MRKLGVTATGGCLMFAFLQGCVASSELAWNRSPPPKPAEKSRPVEKGSMKHSCATASEGCKPVERDASSSNSQPTGGNPQILDQHGGGGGGGGGGGW